MKLRRGFLVSSILAILISLSVISSIPSIKAVGAPSTLWSKDYTSLPGTGISVIQTKDGGYAIAGTSNGQFLFCKTNSSGDIQWNKTYGDGVASSIVQTSDGGYALAGTGTLFNFVKTDSNGNIQWNKTYGEKAVSFMVRSLIQTSDGGYALAGLTSARTNWFVKTDANGNMQWNKTYANGSPNSTIIGGIVEEENNGGYTIAVGILGATYETQIIKTDSNGNVQWNITHFYYYDFFIQTIDGGFLLVGPAVLVKIDSQGKTLWSKSYSGDEVLAVGILRTAIQTRNGGYVAIGTLFRRVGSFNETTAYIVRTDARGNIEWNATYPPTTGKHNLPRSIIESEDGTYVFTGSIGASTYMGYTDGDVWLVKIAPPPDTMSPTILILSPKNKTYPVNNVYLTFTVSETTSWMGYSLDGQANVTITGNTTLTGLSDGSHSLTVYATDIAGNTGSSDIVYFTVDTTCPSISILSPENKTYDTTDIPLNFTVNETASWIGYSLDGQANVTITGNITLTRLSYGAHSLVVYAKDTAGNTGTSETIYFSIGPNPGWPPGLPIVYVYAIVAVTIAAIAAVAGYLFIKRRKSATITETSIAALKG